MAVVASNSVFLQFVNLDLRVLRETGRAKEPSSTSTRCMIEAHLDIKSKLDSEPSKSQVGQIEELEIEETSKKSQIRANNTRFVLVDASSTRGMNKHMP